jgi:hypothetical protein
MKRYLLLLIIPILTACEKPNKIAETNKYFYDFDEVVHYHVDERDIPKSKDEADKDSLTLKFITGWREDGKLDPKLLEKLRQSKFTGKVVDTIFYPELREIFSDKAMHSASAMLDDGSEIMTRDLAGIAGSSKGLLIASTTAAAFCEPVFRNLYLFKKKDKVVGLAKICYECTITQFYGTKANVKGFSASEIESLRKLHKNENFTK